MSDNLDILEHPVDVEPTTGSNPRVLVVVAALIGAGVLAAGIVIGATTAFVTVAEGTSTCSIESPCTGFSLEQVEQRSNLDLDDATIVEATQAGPVFGAEIAVPAGGAPEFGAFGFGSVSEPGTDWSDELDGRELGVIGYYAASGDEGRIVGDVLHARNPDGTETIFVEVTTTP